MYRLISLFIYFLLCYVVPGTTFAVIIPAPPKLNAISYLAMDHHSGQMLVAEKIDERVEPASEAEKLTPQVDGDRACTLGEESLAKSCSLRDGAEV